MYVDINRGRRRPKMSGDVMASDIKKVGVSEDDSSDRVK